MRWAFAVIAVAATAAASGDAQAQEPPQCFPECRAGFECQAGQCVPLEAAVSECVPACRAGHQCQGGQCVPVARERPGRPPREPRGPPKYELSAGAGFIPLVHVDPPDFDDFVENNEFGRKYGGRFLTVTPRMLVRQGQSNRWWGLELGFGLVSRSERVDTGGGGSSGSSGDDSAFILAGELVFRIPLSTPGYHLLLDHKISVDLSAGPFLMKASDLDAGAQVAARLSLFWFHLGVVASHGIRTKLGINFVTAAQIAF